MRIVGFFLLVCTLLSTSFAKDKKSAETEEPIVWGMLAHNNSCVIFKESKKHSGMFYGIAVTVKTYSELEVIETQNYTLEQKKWVETQENINELMRLVQKDRVKFVKIPHGYSDSLLQKAREKCSDAAVPDTNADHPVPTQDDERPEGGPVLRRSTNPQPGASTTGGDSK